MKNITYLKLLGIFIIGFTMITSCSSDDDNTPNDTDAPFLDKWWYDSNDFAADIYFHSDGAYEQKKIVQGIEYTGTGNWVFENENSGIIKIDNLVGNGQVLSDVWLKISNVQNNTITVQQSDNGVDYSAEFLFQDTDN